VERCTGEAASISLWRIYGCTSLGSPYVACCR
jgi:hypothetical protein